MKALVCGDMHLKQGIILPRVEACAAALGVDRIVFMGDYTDGPLVFPSDQLAALELQSSWIDGQRARGVEVDCLMGNHDASYLGGVETSKTLQRFFEEFDETSRALGKLNLKPAASFGPWLLTHAGVTLEWAEKVAPEARTADKLVSALNALEPSRYDDSGLCSVGAGRGGFGLPGPLWAHRTELSSDPFPGISQVVAHSPRKTCERVDASRPDVLLGAFAGCGVEGSRGGTPSSNGEGCELWFVDTHAISMYRRQVSGDGSLLLLDDEMREATVVHPEEYGCEPWKDVARRWMDELVVRDDELWGKEPEV